MRSSFSFFSAAASARERNFEMQCRGLEAYRIIGTYDVDWGYGTIRANDDNLSFGFSIGPMVELSVPDERPPGFRWFKVEKLSKATIRYGYNVREKQLQATITGAPMSSRVNVIGSPGAREPFVALIRTLAVAPCVRRSR